MSYLLVTIIGSIVFQTFHFRNPRSSDAVWAEHNIQPNHGDSSIQREFVSCTPLKTSSTKALDYLIKQKNIESCSKIRFILELIFRWFPSIHLREICLLLLYFFTLVILMLQNTDTDWQGFKGILSSPNTKLQRAQWNFDNTKLQGNLHPWVPISSVSL